MVHSDKISNLKDVVLKVSMVTAMFLFASLLPLQTLADDSGLVLHSTCTSDRCIEMMLNWGSDRPEYATSDESVDGYTTFTFSVDGKLNGNDIATHKVSYEGYTGGLECSDFGQGVVAVLGLDNGKPILETQKGSLEITDKSLSVGCSDCIQIVNDGTGQVLEEYRSPSWDLTMAGIDHNDVAKQFSYDFENRVFFKNKSGTCLMLAKTGPIVDYNSSYCDPLDEIELNDKNHTWSENKNQKRLFKHADLENLLLIHVGSCT